MLPVLHWSIVIDVAVETAAVDVVVTVAVTVDSAVTVVVVGSLQLPQSPPWGLAVAAMVMARAQETTERRVNIARGIRWSGTVAVDLLKTKPFCTPLCLPPLPPFGTQQRAAPSVPRPRQGPPYHLAPRPCRTSLRTAFYYSSIERGQEEYYHSDGSLSRRSASTPGT
ncbi:hypothetical protein PsYK624_085920 [Phanerochaete sordida]|uniref:Secreted protein n=1 Tax=Phanerochaete sordida TaxID=48140 RepID=A0A9P3GCM4_9APHY|nr:hypothetical protein PsYK624_085920 [Phanerochaete sordida]